MAKRLHNSQGKFVSQKPSFMSDEEYAQYKKMKKRFNDRTAKQIKRLVAKTGAEPAQLARIGAVEWKVKGVPKSKNAFKEQMKMFRNTATKEYRDQQKMRMIKRNLEVLDYNYHLHPDAYNAIASKFNSMTKDEIIQWSYAHKDIVADFFNDYELMKAGEMFDAEYLNKKIERILQSLDIEMLPDWYL